jgi:hypothetical protein
MKLLKNFRIVYDNQEYVLDKYETQEYIRTAFGSDFDATFDLLEDIGHRLGIEIEGPVDWITEEVTE